MAKLVKCWNCSGISFPAKFRGKSAAVRCGNCLAGMKITKGKKKTQPAVAGLAKAGKKIPAPAFLAKGAGMITKGEAVGQLEANLRKWSAAHPYVPPATPQVGFGAMPAMLQAQTRSSNPADREAAWQIAHDLDKGLLSPGRVL